MTGGTDPGWARPARRSLPYVLMPMLVLKGSTAGEPPIVLLRAAFLAFVGGLVGFLVVLLFILPFTAGRTTDPVVYALLAVGPFSLATIPWARGRLLATCAPPGELAETYRTMLFLNISFLESAALFGFVASFLAEAAWPYLVGMSVALVGFRIVAPTDSRLRRLDEELARRGCQHSLREGLLDPSGDVSV